jgi:hypothetical protein
VSEVGRRNDRYAGATHAGAGGARGAPDGLIVEASVLARLFGIRLLTLDANVVLSRAPRPGQWPVAYDPPVRSSGAAAPPLPERSRVIGARLAEAERLIDEGQAILAASPPTPVSSAHYVRGSR